MRRILPVVLVLGLCAVSPARADTQDASLVRLVEVSRKDVGGASVLGARIENRLEVPLVELVLSLRVVRDAAPPVVRRVGVQALPGPKATVDVVVDPATLVTGDVLRSAVGLSVDVDTFRVEPEVATLDTLVRTGTDRDLRGALRSIGIPAIPGRSAPLIAPQVRSRAFDRLATPPEAPTVEDGLFGVLLARLVARELEAGEVGALAAWLAEPRWGIPVDTAVRALDKVERAGVLTLLGVPGSRADALGDTLRTAPGLLERFLDAAAGRPPEEQLVLVAAARAALPCATFARTPAETLAPLVNAAGRLVPTDWNAGLLLTADRNGDAAAGARVAEFPPETLLPWAVPEAAWLEARLRLALGARADVVPEAVRATLAKDVSVPLQEAVGKLQAFDPAGIPALWRLSNDLRGEGSVPLATLARLAAREWISDPTVESRGWVTLATLQAGFTPGSPDADTAIDLLLHALASPELEPERSLGALDFLAAFVTGEARKTALREAYAAFAEIPDAALAGHARDRAGLGPKPAAAPKGPPGWLVVGLAVGAGVLGLWLLRGLRGAR